VSSVNRDLDAGQLLSAVGATTSQNTADQVNVDHAGVKVYINVSNAGTGSITVAIQGKDPGSGTYFTILASAAIVANGLTVLTVYPGITAVTNVSASDCLSRQWRISVTANNANPVNYTIGATLIAS
jgi:hypothetical protein